MALFFIYEHTRKVVKRMKEFEISSKKNKNGKRKFKAILCKIFPDSCVDEVNQVGTEFNKNGITWIREYCEKALPNIKGMSLRCEFINDERTELSGHGDTDIIDGDPVFENAVQIGTFTNGYIDDVETDEGTITVCIGEGEIDALCYHNFVTKLDTDIANNIYPNGSVEIMHTENNKEIVYKYGYKAEGRIPMEFIFSGYALLGVTPADDSARLIELNKKHEEDLNKMNDLEIKALIEQTVAAMTNHASEINKCKTEYEAKVAETNEALKNAIAEKNEIEASVEKLKAALEQVQNDYKELDKKYSELWEERKTLEKALAEAQAKERIGELNVAIADFTDDEKAYAKPEIDAFTANPSTSEINSVVNKIWEGIGRKAREDAIVAEKNSAEKGVTIEDIFSAIETKPVAADINIFD